MFTGIISSIGTIARTEENQGDLEVQVVAPGIDFAAVAIGDSICVAGVCLTVTVKNDAGFNADVSRETLNLTTLGMLQAGDSVNLELALKAGDGLGGHLVGGHVDERARVLNRTADARSERFEFRVSQSLSRFIAQKGSVCIDGVSLTVNDVDGRNFGVNLIPHTLENTTLGRLQTGDWVNIEADMLARYVGRLNSLDL